MKKIIHLSLVISLIIVCLSACNSKEHEHIDKNADGVCDTCGYDGLATTPAVAQIVIDYEKNLKDEIDKLNTEKPEYEFYYNPVDKIHCIYILKNDASANAILEKYDMSNIFAGAKVEAYDAIKMVGIYFDRDNFTESMHEKLKEIKDKEPLIESLSVDMERDFIKSYMPRIEHYTDNAVELEYVTTNNLINLINGKDLIIKSKEEYDEYINYLLEEGSEYLQESIKNQKDLYDESFFEENALIVTKKIIRTSGSIKLTVNSLYASDNKLYVVVRTDVPGEGTDDMQYTSFTLIVPKNQVVNVDEVITLE